MKEKLPEDTNVLIASDHEMKKAFPMRYEFYGVNMLVKIDHPDVTDFMEAQGC